MPPTKAGARVAAPAYEVILQAPLTFVPMDMMHEPHHAEDNSLS